MGECIDIHFLFRINKKRNYFLIFFIDNGLKVVYFINIHIGKKFVA